MPPVASPMAMSDGEPIRPASAMTTPAVVTLDPIGIARAAAIDIGVGVDVGVGVGVGVVIGVGVAIGVGRGVVMAVGVGDGDRRSARRGVASVTGRRGRG
jgi:hypothetical protein